MHGFCLHGACTLLFFFLLDSSCLIVHLLYDPSYSARDLVLPCEVSSPHVYSQTTSTHYNADELACLYIPVAGASHRLHASTKSLHSGVWVNLAEGLLRFLVWEIDTILKGMSHRYIFARQSETQQACYQSHQCYCSASFHAETLSKLRLMETLAICYERRDLHLQIDLAGTVDVADMTSPMSATLFLGETWVSTLLSVLSYNCPMSLPKIVLSQWYGTRAPDTANVTQPLFLGLRACWGCPTLTCQTQPLLLVLPSSLMGLRV